MRHNLPKHVRKKVAKGKAYYYFDTGRANEAGRPLMVRLPDVRSPEFGAKLAALQGARTKRKGKEGALTLAFLADLFERSVEFRRLAPATQNSYRLYLKTARGRLGIAPADQLTPEDVMIVRDEMAETPGAANQLIRV